MSRPEINVAYRESAVIHDALNFAAAADDMKLAHWTAGAADHIVGGGDAVGKFNQHRLTVNYIIIQLPDAFAVRIIFAFQKFLFLLQGWILNMLQSSPDIESPAVGVVQTVFARGI